MLQAIGPNQPGALRLWACKSRERLNQLVVVPKAGHREKFFREIFGSASLEDLINGDDGEETVLVDLRMRAEL
jgi:hypothetical protein